MGASKAGGSRPAQTQAGRHPGRRRREKSVRTLTRAWLLLCLVLCAHVADEALTGFLGVYNPTVSALHAKYAWFPMPAFTFSGWVTLLAVVCIVLLLMTLWVVGGSRAARWAAYVFGAIMLLNGVAHFAATIHGGTVAGVTFAGPMPGVFTSPLLVVGGIYLLYAAVKAGRDLKSGGLLARAASGKR